MLRSSWSTWALALFLKDRWPGPKSWLKMRLPRKLCMEKICHHLSAGEAVSQNSLQTGAARKTRLSWLSYSRRFATATARTASLGSHSRGIETKNIRKYWLSEKKTRRIWWPCIADQRSSKNNEKHEKTAKLLLFTVFLRGEKQKPLQIPWFLRVRWPKTL